MKIDTTYITLVFLSICVACTSSNSGPTANAGTDTIAQPEAGPLDPINESGIVIDGSGAVGGTTVSQAGSGGLADARQSISTGGKDDSSVVVPESGKDSGETLRPEAGSTGDGSTGNDASLGDASSSVATLPAVTSVDTAGPFRTTQALNTGPSRTSGLFYPTELGIDGLKHPVFVWGCGGMSSPANYIDVLAQIASHGFVVIGEVSAIGDNGVPLVACIDWIINENNRAQSVFFQKVDTGKIALGGHSIGSVNSFLVATDPRLTTTIHVAGGSLDNINDPNAETTGKGGKSLIHPVAYICSENDMFGNVEKTEKDYANTTVPAFMTIMSGTEHIGAARAGLPVMTGWLRWHLGGETERRAMFLEPAGEFCTGIYVSKNKNW
ncbi:MAG: hypothetical protein JXA30_00495 [Deltaproteobacteria bacterium]|nr:hypothetical protein [Deltaproteobacteria bacterium]